MPDLDRALRATHDRLLAEIEPDLGAVRERAVTLRRRRVGVRVTALVLLVLVGGGMAAVQPWAGTPGPDDGQPIAATPSPSGGPIWSSLGLTLNGLIQPYEDLPGDLVDLEFIDPDRGYALLRQCTRGTCTATLADTRNGGRTWTSHPVPDPGATDLLVPGLDWLGVAGPGGVSAYSINGGVVWSLENRTGSKPIGRLPDDAVLRVGNGTLAAWSINTGRLSLAHQPPLRPVWVPSPRVTGTLWVGGVDRATGVPALAASPDRGNSWQRVDLPDPVSAPAGSWVQVASLGADVYAAVVAPDRTVVALYRSTDRGERFVRTRADRAERITLSGDLVPLLDGRLLVADVGGAWQVSDDHGQTFRRAIEMPSVGRITRTAAGYVAINLFGTGFAAYSSDGLTWRKIHLA